MLFDKVSVLAFKQTNFSEAGEFLVAYTDARVLGAWVVAAVLAFLVVRFSKKLHLNLAWAFWRLMA